MAAQRKIESTIVQFPGHSTFLKGLQIEDVVEELEGALGIAERFYFMHPVGQPANSVALDPKKIVAFYRHVEYVDE